MPESIFKSKVVTGLGIVLVLALIGIAEHYLGTVQ